MKLFTVVANTLKIDPQILSDESNGHNTPNWDSLRHIELMMAVETAFQVRFSMAEIVGLKNLGDMRRLLESKGALDDSDLRASA